MPRKAAKQSSEKIEDAQHESGTETTDKEPVASKGKGGSAKASAATGEGDAAVSTVRKGRASKAVVEEVPQSTEEQTATPRKGRGARAKAEQADTVVPPEATTRKGRGSKAATTSKSKDDAAEDVADSLEPEESPPAKKQKVKGSAIEKAEKAASKPEKAPAEKVLIERSKVERHIPDGPSFKVISWNVTTLRSLVNKNPDLLKKLIASEKPDLICIQEIKLTPQDQVEYETKLKEIIPGCALHWNFCTLPESKSYAGTLAIVIGGSVGGTKTIDSFFSGGKSAKPQQSVAEDPVAAKLKKVVNVTMNLPTLTEADGPVAKEVNSEGRTITIEYDSFFVVACYVPNSGDKLQRLDFRTKVWDVRLGEYLLLLEKRKPVIFCGDLNVAHLDADIWNVGAKHLVKSAGTTPAEREGFSNLLAKGFVDSFRELNPSASGWFSYWSVRAGNQPFNRGLRLDYFVTSASLFPKTSSKPAVVDVAILPDFVAIDHAAIALTLTI